MSNSYSTAVQLAALAMIIGIAIMNPVAVVSWALSPIRWVLSLGLTGLLGVAGLLLYLWWFHKWLFDLIMKLLWWIFNNPILALLLYLLLMLLWDYVSDSYRQSKADGASPAIQALSSQLSQLSALGPQMMTPSSDPVTVLVRGSEEVADFTRHVVPPLATLDTFAKMFGRPETAIKSIHALVCHIQEAGLAQGASLVCVKLHRLYPAHACS